MMKKILILTIAVFALAMPFNAEAQDIQQSRPAVEQEVAPIAIMVSELTVVITNADKEVLRIYNMAGVCVATIRIEGSERHIDLNHMPKGCYILKVGKVARKVYLK